MLGTVALVKEKSARLFIVLIFSVLFIGVATSLYHIGVEKHIFKMTEGCAMSYQNMMDVDALYEYISSKEVVRCDIEQKFLGLPLSQLNLFYLLFVLLVGYILCKKYGCQKIET